MRKSLFLVFLLTLVLAFSPIGTRANAAAQAPEAKIEAEKSGAEDSLAENVIVDKGVRVEFAVEPAYGQAGEPKPILEGEYAEVRFRITDAATPPWSLRFGSVASKEWRRI